MDRKGSLQVSSSICAFSCSLETLPLMVTHQDQNIDFPKVLSRILRVLGALPLQVREGYSSRDECESYSLA